MRSDSKRLDLTWLPSHRNIPPPIKGINRLLETLKASTVFHFMLTPTGEIFTTQCSSDSHTMNLEEPAGWRILESLKDFDPGTQNIQTRGNTGFVNQSLQPCVLSLANVRERSIWFFRQDVSAEAGHSVVLFELKGRTLAAPEFGLGISIAAQAVDHLLSVFISEQSAGPTNGTHDLDQTANRTVPMPRAADALHRLSPFEMSILVAMCEGLSNVEIGRRLSKSVSTVRAATSRIYDNLGVRNRQAAISYAAPRLTPPQN
jgi:DNA-binding CsgD family transcriptional regulator